MIGCIINHIKNLYNLIFNKVIITPIIWGNLENDQSNKYQRILYGRYKEYYSRFSYNWWCITLRWSYENSWEVLITPIDIYSGNLVDKRRRKIDLDKFYFKYEIYQVKEFVSNFIINEKNKNNKKYFWSNN